jgi:hypothetical protein
MRNMCMKVSGRKNENFLKISDFWKIQEKFQNQILKQKKSSKNFKKLTKEINSDWKTWTNSQTIKTHSISLSVCVNIYF